MGLFLPEIFDPPLFDIEGSWLGIVEEPVEVVRISESPVEVLRIVEEVS